MYCVTAWICDPSLLQPGLECTLVSIKGGPNGSDIDIENQKLICPTPARRGSADGHSGRYEIEGVMSICQVLQLEGSVGPMKRWVAAAFYESVPKF